MGLTMLRLLLLPAFLWALLKDASTPSAGYHWLAIAIFAVMAITDKLDGYLARRLNQTTKLGAILDPVADKLLIACSVILLSFPTIAPRHFAIPLWVVAFIYGKDLLVALGVLLLLSFRGKVTIIARPLGKISTALQLFLVLLVLLAPAEQSGWFAFAQGLMLVLCGAVALLATLASLDYVGQGVRQLRRRRDGESTNRRIGESAMD